MKIPSEIYLAAFLKILVNVYFGTVSSKNARKNSFKYVTMSSSILVHHDTFSKSMSDTKIFFIHILISEKKILSKFTERKKKYFLLELRNETCGQKVQLH